jgi:hypothetical protein
MISSVIAGSSVRLLIRDQTLPVIRDDHRKPLARYRATLGRARSRLAPPSYTAARDRTDQLCAHLVQAVEISGNFTLTRLR